MISTSTDGFSAYLGANGSVNSPGNYMGGGKRDLTLNLTDLQLSLEELKEILLAQG